MSSVDILNTEFGWVNREDGTPISTTPIDFSPDSFTNVPGVKTTIPAGTILAGKSFNGFDVAAKVSMADPVPFVQLNVQELKNYNQGYIELPYIGVVEGRHVYQIDSTFAPFADGTVLDVAADAIVVAELVTSSYPSQAIMPINFNCGFLALVEGGGVPPSGCFWTDLVGVSQDCDTTPPEPPADFIFQNMPGGILKVCVATARNLTDGGVASSVLVQDGFSELLLWDHGDENASNDPLVGSGIMSPGVRHCTMSETTVYAANIDFSVGSGALMMAAIPYATFRGNFTSYTYDVNVGAAIGFDGSTDSLIGIEWYPQESSVIMLISKGATRGLEIWAKYDNSDLATGWQKQGEIPAPASPASLSDNKLYYDGQINSVVLQNNNGRPGSENIWWAYSLGRASGTGGVRPNGYNTLITVTGGALYWNGRYRFWQTDSGETYLIGNDGDDNLVKCDFSGNVSPLFTDSAVSGFEPFGSAEGGGELGSRVFIAPRTDCSGTDVFGFLWRMDGDRVPTTVNLAYMGCQIYASATGLKRVFGRITNQCI